MTDQTDPFEQQAQDPFGETVTVDAAAEVAATDPAGAETPEVSPEAADAPIVDREGQPISGEASLADQLDPPAPVEAAQEAAQAGQEGEGAPEQPEEPQTPPVAAEEGQEPPADAQEASQGAEAPQEAPQTLETPEVAQETPAAAPTTGPRGGTGEMRRYKLLYQTAERQWTEYDLSTVDGPKLGVTIATEDGESWMLARNNEHAVRVAFAVLNRPAEGVTAFPVPKGAWKPKRIKPAPPAPLRERLEIS